MEKKHGEPLTEASKPNIDMNLLSQAMEAFNSATVKLQSSYEILQEEARKLREEIEDKNKKLTDITKLLDSVLNNTLSAILVVDNSKIIIKNRAGDKLLNDIGEEGVAELLKASPHLGVFDYEDGQGRFFRVSVGGLTTENLNGSVYVVDDITDLKMLEQEKQRGEKLQLIGEMAANIAHEIRNPLGSMELFASLLERELTDPNQKRLTTNIVKAIRIINGIVSNTLLFTKDLQIEKQRYVLADIVDDVILYLQHVLKEKKITIINKLDEEHTVDCDKELFRQVVVNLVHNAIDAVSSEKGVVTIESYTNDNYVGLVITDNGLGLSENMKNKLFMPFQTTKAKGTGLGLYISYKIVVAHGGDITVESDGSSYAKFNVTLPYLKK